MINVRDATSDDAVGMSTILSEILSSWKSKRPSSPGFILENYIRHPDQIKCSVALDKDSNIKGFQSLKIASNNNPYGLPVGWGVIGTYVSLNAGRQGIGKALFSLTLEAARKAKLSIIDATIGETNNPGLAYYEAMGFCTYQTRSGVVCKKLNLSPQ